MSIVAMKQEIENQPEDLAMFAEMLRETPRPLPVLARAVFTGSGDSWATALFARELSKGTVLAEDPYELTANLGFARSRTLVIVSVSGRTRANIELARKAKTSATRLIAVTSNAESALARVCDSLVILQYRKAGALTSGTVSFSESLLACAALLGKLPRSLKLESCLDDAEAWARGVKPSGRGHCLFVGSGVDRALAEYGACKVQEVLGSKASAVYPEQVGHALLFSLNPASDTVVCIDSSGRHKMRELYERMSRSGFSVHKVFLTRRDTVTGSLAVSFYLQHLALFNAQRMRLVDCAFLRNKSRLRLSNRLIY